MTVCRHELGTLHSSTPHPSAIPTLQGWNWAALIKRAEVSFDGPQAEAARPFTTSRWWREHSVSGGAISRGRALCPGFLASCSYAVTDRAITRHRVPVTHYVRRTVTCWTGWTGGQEITRYTHQSVRPSVRLSHATLISCDVWPTCNFAVYPDSADVC